MSGEDGRDALRRILRDAQRFLAPDGTLLVEVGQGQAPAFAKALTKAGFKTTHVHRDLGGIERMVEARVATESSASEAELHTLESGVPNDADFEGEQRAEWDEPEAEVAHDDTREEAFDPEKSGE